MTDTQLLISEVVGLSLFLLGVLSGIALIMRRRAFRCGLGPRTNYGGRVHK
jgi:hypothetical protein